MDTWILILLWIITILLAVMSVILLLGRGSGLIAGYNMMSDSQKEKYDESKLSRVMGGGLFVITLTLMYSVLFKFDFPNKMIEYIVISVILISVLLMLVLGHFSCRKKK